MRDARSLFLTVALSAAPLSAQRASFVTSGLGCPAPTPPTLGLTGAPVIGTTPSLTVSGLPGDAVFPFALLAGTQTNVPLGFLGATGCTLLVDNILASLPMSLTPPTATIPIALPANPAFVGVVLEIQAGALSLSSNPFGLATSDRGTMTIGPVGTVLLRNASCAPSIACTNGGNAIISAHSGPAWNTSPFYFDASATNVFTAFQGIGHAAIINWNSTSWELDIWKPGATTTLEQELILSPTTGNFASDIRLSQTHRTLPNGDYLVQFVPTVAVVVPPGNYLVSVQAINNGWLWRETTMPLRSDILTSSPSPNLWFTYNPQLGLPVGAQAVDVIGY